MQLKHMRIIRTAIEHARLDVTMMELFEDYSCALLMSSCHVLAGTRNWNLYHRTYKRAASSAVVAYAGKLR